MTLTANSTLPETYQLAALAPASIQVLMQGLDFLFLRYVQDQGGDHQLIAGLIKKQGGFGSFLKKVYGDTYDWDSTELFDIETLRKFLEKISEIGGFWYEENLSYEERISFDFSKGETPMGFLGKKFFENKNIQTNDIDFVETFLRYHLIERWIQRTELYKNEVDELEIRESFSRDLRYFMRTILVPSVGIFDMADSSELIERILFLLSKAQELPIALVIDFNTQLESMSREHHEEERSIQEELIAINHQMMHLITSTCGPHGTMEFTRFRVQTVLIGEKNIDDPSKCFIKLLPPENFYFRKDEEIVSVKPEEFPIQGNMLSDKNLIVGPKDCNIFDSSGNKVFWGDMSQSDIEKIQGTHYILTRSEGWSEVPDFLKGNVRSIGPARDIFSPGYIEDPSTGLPIQIANDVQWVHPDYVRMMAEAKIEDGKYIENLRKIEF